MSLCPKSSNLSTGFSLVGREFQDLYTYYYIGLFICQPRFLAQTNMALFFIAVTFEEELFVEPGPSPL